MLLVPRTIQRSRSLLMTLTVSPRQSMKPKARPNHRQFRPGSAPHFAGWSGQSKTAPVSSGQVPHRSDHHWHSWLLSELPARRTGEQTRLSTSGVALRGSCGDRRCGSDLCVVLADQFTYCGRHHRGSSHCSDTYLEPGRTVHPPSIDHTHSAKRRILDRRTHRCAWHRHGSLTMGRLLGA